jgi:hypothetical protein
MFKHEKWAEIVVFALDTGAYWMEVSNQLPDGDNYTNRLADAIRDEKKGEVEHLTALLIVKLAARLSGTPQALTLKTFGEKWCRLFEAMP